jgi:hypothetical protein
MGSAGGVLSKHDLQCEKSRTLVMLATCHENLVIEPLLDVFVQNIQIDFRRIRSQRG